MNTLCSWHMALQVSMVSRLKHENVVELLGYSVDGGLRILAYEYASNGSLHDILHGELPDNYILVVLTLLIAIAYCY